MVKKLHEAADDTTVDYLEQAAGIYAAMHGSTVDVGAAAGSGRYVFTLGNNERAAHEVIHSHMGGLVVNALKTLDGADVAALLIEAAAKYTIVGRGLGLQEAEARAFAERHPPRPAKPEPIIEAPPEVTR